MSEAATAAWRPGVVQGPCPERGDERPPALARLVHAAVGAFAVPRSVTRSAVSEFGRLVDAQACGLQDVSDARFDEALVAVRMELRRRGLHEPLMPRAFALVREAARRTLGTPHYDVQLYGGWVMARRGLAELETGEGKTLTATLPASVAGLAGIPTHLITSNDYLVERDAESMRPIYERLGLTVGTVLEEQPDRAARRAAYACDVTYVTNKQLTFDYLQDRLALSNFEALSDRFSRIDVHEQSGAVLRGLCFAIIDEADSVLIDDARMPVILSRQGTPADEPTIRTALWLARSLEPDLHYRVNRDRSDVRITRAGHARLGELAEAITGLLAGARRRTEWVQRALCADQLFERDTHYLVHDGGVQLIDAPTGRRSPDRCFEGGMHSLIEAKEGLTLTPQRETAVRVSYQRLFRRYLRLAGMTGTAREVARELWNVYGLRTVSVPTRRPSRREGRPLRVLPSVEEKWQAAIERVRELHAAGRPVLVGTATVSASEELDARLDEAGLEHQVLNARQDREEAEVIARAGEPGRITVATRMAGRGAGIRLDPAAEQAGGLAVIATELGEAARIDRQLFGRSGRQGSPGSYEQLASLDDRLFRAHLPEWLRRLLLRNARGGGVPLLFFSRRVQKAEERRGALARRRLMDSERVIEELLAFSGDRD